MIEWIIFQIVGVEGTFIGVLTNILAFDFRICVCQHVDYIFVHVANNIFSAGSEAVHVLGDAVGAGNSVFTCVKKHANVRKGLCRGVEVGDVVTIQLVFTNLSAFCICIDLGDRINEIILIIVTLHALSRADSRALKAIDESNQKQ